MGCRRWRRRCRRRGPPSTPARCCRNLRQIQVAKSLYFSLGDLVCHQWTCAKKARFLNLGTDFLFGGTYHTKKNLWLPSPTGLGPLIFNRALRRTASFTRFGRRIPSHPRRAANPFFFAPKESNRALLAFPKTMNRAKRCHQIGRKQLKWLGKKLSTI